MPISGPSSYIPTINLFLAHWEDANTANGSSIDLPEGIDRDGLEADRDDLANQQAAVEDRLNDVEIGNATLFQQKDALRERLLEFNRRVRGLLPGSAFERALPDAPNIGSAQGAFTKPLQDMDSLWQKINTAQDPDPFLLSGDYAVADFQTDLNALTDAYITDADNEQELKLARDARNVLQEKIVPILVSYRRVIEALFAPGSAIIESLPALYPAPGHTPDAVTAEGIWDAGTSMALITYSESADNDLEEYQLRRSPVSPYNTAEEHVVATNPAEATREFSTADGLTSPGDTALYRVYVILNTGNEKGSETVVVTRPAE